VRLRFEWGAHETIPSGSEVLRLQGLPPEREVSPRIRALLDAALEEYQRACEPRAIVGDITPEVFAHVYSGEGKNDAETPLEGIYPQAERLALFVATVGAPITVRIHDLFGSNEPALGAMLDSVASAAADRLAELVGSRLLRETGVDAAERLEALAYSPGYCGWHVSGQRSLFERLAPEEIGVTLNASCLMHPLKSVSGVIVAGPGRIHRFPPDFPFCAECADKPCRARIAAALRSDA